MSDEKISEEDYEEMQRVADAACELAGRISKLCTSAEPSAAAIALSLVRSSHEKELGGITEAADQFVEKLNEHGALKLTRGDQ